MKKLKIIGSVVLAAASIGIQVMEYRSKTKKKKTFADSFKNKFKALA